MSYIIFDGVDGAGKTSIIEWVAHTLQQRGQKVVTLAFPAKTGLGAMIRTGWADPNFFPEAAWPLMHLAEQVTREREIVTALRAGYTVLCDRHAFTSGPAYAPLFYSRALLAELRWNLALTQPNLIAVIDVEPNVALTRVSRRAQKDIHEVRLTDALIAERAQKILSSALSWVTSQRVVVVPNNTTLREATDTMLDILTPRGHV